MKSDIPPEIGQVYLVGAGPGDPGLITLRGAECLGRADIVLYDYLVNPLILLHARPGAELVCLGRHGQPRTYSQPKSSSPLKIVPQQEINERLLHEARQGKVVVRLKGGDPAVFARGAEEAEVLAANGIPFEIVPGITAALAAGSFAGIPVTHRDMASAVALVTGREKSPEDSKLDFSALAAFPGTLVFYMGVTTARQWTEALITAGRNAEEPAAIVRRCSWSDQETIECTLGTVAEQLEHHAMRPPAIVILGDVCSLASTLSWVQERPLFGQSVLVTRPEHQAQAMCGQLGDLGSGCLVQPAISISEPADWSPVDEALANLDQFTWLVFSSANGVRYLLDRLISEHGDLRQLGSIRLAAIGPRTADELAKYHLRADLAPEEYRAEALAAELAKEAAGAKFLLARASRGREVLAEQLAAAGGEVTQVVVYESRDVAEASPEVADAIEVGKIDWVTVTSSAIARSLVAMFGEQLRKTKLASISPITTATLGELGHNVAVEASEYTTAGVIDAILAAETALNEGNR